MAAWPILKYHPIYFASSAAAAFTSWKADAINTLWVLRTSSVITVYWMENTFPTKPTVFHARLVIIMNSGHAANIISMQLILALYDLRFRHHTHEAWLCPQEENNNEKVYGRISDTCLQKCALIQILIKGHARDNKDRDATTDRYTFCQSDNLKKKNRTKWLKLSWSNAFPMILAEDQHVKMARGVWARTDEFIPLVTNF